MNTDSLIVVENFYVDFSAFIYKMLRTVAEDIDSKYRNKSPINNTLLHFLRHVMDVITFFKRS